MEVYIITNLVNGKYYVGQTASSKEKRWIGHRCAAKLLRTRCIIHKAINKYGESNFIIETLSLATSRDQLDNLERLWITLLDSTNANCGYNLTYGADGGMSHSGPLTIEHKLKIGLANKGRTSAMKGKKHSEATKLKISISHKALDRHPVYSIETRSNWSKARKGKSRAVPFGPITEEAHNNISEAAKRTWANRKLKKAVTV